jgi:hypothetical protein
MASNSEKVTSADFRAMRMGILTAWAGFSIVPFIVKDKSRLA